MSAFEYPTGDVGDNGLNLRGVVSSLTDLVLGKSGALLKGFLFFLPVAPRNASAPLLKLRKLETTDFFSPPISCPPPPAEGSPPPPPNAEAKVVAANTKLNGSIFFSSIYYLPSTVQSSYLHLKLNYLFAFDYIFVES